MRTAFLILCSTVSMYATAQTTPGTAMCDYKGAKFPINAIRTAGKHSYQCVCTQTAANMDCAPAWKRIPREEKVARASTVTPAPVTEQKKATPATKTPLPPRQTSQSLIAKPMNQQPIKK